MHFFRTVSERKKRFASSRICVRKHIRRPLAALQLPKRGLQIHTYARLHIRHPRGAGRNNSSAAYTIAAPPPAPSGRNKFSAARASRADTHCTRASRYSRAAARKPQYSENASPRK